MKLYPVRRYIRKTTTCAEKLNDILKLYAGNFDQSSLLF